jgi:hypothetical protein
LKKIKQEPDVARPSRDVEACDVIDMTGEAKASPSFATDEETKPCPGCSRPVVIPYNRKRCSVTSCILGWGVEFCWDCLTIIQSGYHLRCSSGKDFQQRPLSARSLPTASISIV